MKRYFKKSTKEQFYAIQWTGKNTGDVLKFIGENGKPNAKTGQIVLSTPCGKVSLNRSDFILKTEMGEFYAHPADSFNRNYENENKPENEGDGHAVQDIGQQGSAQEGRNLEGKTDLQEPGSRKKSRKSAESR